MDLTIHFVDLDRTILRPGSLTPYTNARAYLEELRRTGVIWWFSCRKPTRRLRAALGKLSPSGGYIQKPFAHRYTMHDDKLDLEGSWSADV